MTLPTRNRLVMLASRIVDQTSSVAVRFCAIKANRLDEASGNWIDGGKAPTSVRQSMFTLLWRLETPNYFACRARALERIGLSHRP